MENMPLEDKYNAIKLLNFIAESLTGQLQTRSRRAASMAAIKQRPLLNSARMGNLHELLSRFTPYLLEEMLDIATTILTDIKDRTNSSSAINLQYSNN